MLLNTHFTDNWALYTFVDMSFGLKKCLAVNLQFHFTTIKK